MTTAALIGNSSFSLLNFRGSLIRRLVDKGVRVLGLAPDHDEASRAQLRALGTTPVDISLNRAGTGIASELGDVLSLRRTLRALRPDVTLAYFAKPVIYGGLAARLARIPRHFAMIEGLGYVFANDAQSRSARRVALRSVTANLYRLALLQAEQVMFLNEDDLREFRQRSIIGPTKGTNIGAIGVDLDFFRGTPPPAVGPLTFLMMARLISDKGVREFARAAAKVRAARPETRFVLLGGLDDNPNSVTRAEVESWVAEGILEWRGHSADVRGQLAECSVFVLPSYYREGVPRSSQEALAMSRPIITTTNVGCRETLVDGRNGFAIAPRDVEALVSAMNRFLDEPHLVPEMGRESRILAEERFDQDAANDRILRVLGL